VNAKPEPGSALAAAPDWRGVFPALCTPFTSELQVDASAQRRVVRFAVDSGAHGLVAFGLAGEVFTLTADERKALTEVLVDEVAGAVPLLVGVGAAELETGVDLARTAERAGAAGIVISCQPGSPLDADGLVDYFVRIAGEVSLPVMIQDAPDYLGVALGPELVERIATAASNVRMVKLEAGAPRLREWIDWFGADLSIWGGNGGIYLLDSARAGSPAVVPGVEVVDRLVEIYEVEAGGDHANAEQLFRELLPLLVFEMHDTIDHYNACAKRVLVHRQVLANALLRPPATELTLSAEMILDRHLAHVLPVIAVPDPAA
jgi:4-hydroxy-tetrahydrodipicolinate synthase